LRLVTLVACNGGALSSNDAFSGLAGRLVERGLPAVLGMSRPVRIDAAELFTDHVYRNLARDGQVDAAVNEARQQLFLKEPNQVGWSSPVLYMRLDDGRLWNTEEADDRSLGAGTPGTPVPVTVVAARRPWSWVRQAVLALVTVVLGLALWPASRVEADFDLIVSGVSFQLAERQPVVGRFRLSELAASFLDEIRLPRSLDRPDPIRASDLSRPLGMILRAGDPPSEITLQQTIVPADMVVSIEHLEAMSYRLSIERRSPLAEEAAPPTVELAVSADGPARFKMLHETRWMAVAGESLETLRLKPLHDKAEIDVTFRRLAGDAFSQPLTVSGLRLFEVEEKTDAGGTVVVEVSTIRAGSAVLTLSGMRHQLKEKEELRFARPRGELYRIEPCQDGIRAGLRLYLGRRRHGISPV
ncbi:MAG: CHAT domain-containing protein, partial [bacterium]|nr:CHAT domain-containing protein [bacterium]